MSNQSQTLKHDSTCWVCESRSPREQRCSLPEGDVFHCDACDAESIEPLPTNARLDAAYQCFDAGQIARSSFAAYSEQATEILRKDLAVIGIPENAGGIKPRFLDYGCGGGHFVKAAGNLGFAAFGMDLDSSSQQFGRAQGLSIFAGDASELTVKVGAGLFRAVLLMHVIEHVPRPLDTLRRLISCVEPNGVVIIGVPDQRSFPSVLKKALRVAGIKRAEWGFVQPPIHLHGLSLPTFDVLARKLGMKIVSARKTSPLDQKTFPATDEYWKGLGPQRLVYRVGRWLGSPGHLKVVLQKPESQKAA
jgi:SAM-dependent methyltransferase